MKPRQPPFTGDIAREGQVPIPADPQRDLKDERADSLFKCYPLERLFCLDIIGPLPSLIS